ncbi:hypothetical protein BDV93DRAFT_459974 [Ceratobasidium sp. AG-I]|nr:hypothetical protein BDV93DRAFT_459974 [Ceratobasidium sp. AG-I]
MSKNASERSEQKRMEYLLDIGYNYTPDQLVFVDESSFDRRTTYRGYAWSLSGTEARRYAFRVRGRRFSILPALSLDGILYVEILEGSFTARTFYSFVQGLLNTMQPFPAPNSVIVMDNCSIHKHRDILDLITERYANFYHECLHP